MAGQFRLLILAGFVASAALAEPTTPAPIISTTPPDHPRLNRGLKSAAMSPEFADVRKAIEALTPEQRQRFAENFRRWGNLSPDEKKALADRDAFRRRRIEEDVDEALAGSGLTLDSERRTQFAKRYAVERRKIEEQLRKDSEEKRRPLVQEMIAKLKVEFAPDAPAPGAAPAAPPQP